jgi:predicted amidohydrolase YtcJ
MNFLKNWPRIASVGLLVVLAGCASAQPPADLILYNTKVWTADESAPYAEAVAIRGERIVSVGSDAEVLALKGSSTRMLDLEGRLVTPGFIDGHTHFENAIGWFYEARLMDVSNEAQMVERLKEAVARVPEGMWVTGGDWGEMDKRAASKSGNPDFLAFEPSLPVIDAVSKNHPVLLRRHNGDYFMNSFGMKLMRITQDKGNPSGGEYVRDPETGELTGMLLRRGGSRSALALPPMTRAKSLIAARAIVDDLNSVGITGIHDISRIDSVSQKKMYHTHVERSHSDLSLFEDMRDEGSLTLGVYGMLPLTAWDGLSEAGVTPGYGDEYIHVKTLKSFVDGYLMFEPYANNPEYAGDFTFRVPPDVNEMADDVVGADALGYDMGIHVIGDRAISIALDWVERAIEINGPRDRRTRMIHFEYPGMEEIERAAAIDAFADVSPVHMLHVRDSIQPKYGPEREKTAHAWRTFIDKGVSLLLVSDFPGDFYKLNPKPVNPMVVIFQAVERREPGEPAESAWHPEEGITVEEGLAAFTINPARAAHEETVKGSISEGKFADIAVLEHDILTQPIDAMPDTEVEYTIFRGKIVYDRTMGLSGGPVE